MTAFIGAGNFIPCVCKAEDSDNNGVTDIEFMVFAVAVTGRQPNCDMVLFTDRHGGSDIDTRVCVKDGGMNVNTGRVVSGWLVLVARISKTG